MGLLAAPRMLSAKGGTCRASPGLLPRPLMLLQVDQWLDVATATLAPGVALEGGCTAANAYMALRTYLVGHALSLADLAAWGQLASTLQWDRVRKGGALPHLERWYALCAEQPELAAVAAEFGPVRRGGGGGGGKAASAPADAEPGKGRGERGCGAAGAGGCVLFCLVALFGGGR